MTKAEPDDTMKASAAGQTGQNTPNDAPEPIAAVEPAFEPQEGSWRGHPRYMCRECGYDSLRREQVVDHIRMVHSGKPQLVTGYRDRTPNAKRKG